MSAHVRRPVREALALLGIRRFLLGVHDAAFPMLPAEDVGRGAPGADGAAALIELASSLGFDGLQLGPQGATSSAWEGAVRLRPAKPPAHSGAASSGCPSVRQRASPSPYDGTLFARDPLAVALAPLTRPEWGSLVRPETLEAVVARRPGPMDRVAHAHAADEVPRALAEACARFRELRVRGVGAAPEMAARLDAFRAAHADWLARDALHEILAAKHGGASWRAWPAEDRDLFAPAAGAERAAAERRASLLAYHATEVEDHALVQLLAHEQHQLFRERARRAGLALFGDLQVGLSERDAWASRGFLLHGWRMGAPPSRTDPGGQAWGFPVLDPRAYHARTPDGTRGDGPVLRFLRARVRKAFAEYDGVRVDHPHGLVCPWVYRAWGDPGAAVRAGARLFESPELPEHPELAEFAIARADQLDPTVPRHSDGWVVSLDADQVDRYAALLDVVMESAPDRTVVACEILSTQPYPLARVIERHRLGRFRVTQKADLDDPRDVYRSENARPEDWIMLGNHDTPTIWTVAEGWVENGTARRHADHLASRLLAEGEDREAWVREVAADPAALAQARFAELFVGPARNVFVAFTDLMGERRPYNVPGTVSDDNWTLRLPHDAPRVHADRVAARQALDIPNALARALRSRGPKFANAHGALIRELEAAAGA